MPFKENTSVIVLAGGKGTRVRALYPDIPKPMIPVAGRPFIEWIIQYFARQGLKKFVISLGYLAHVVQEYIEQRPFDGALITTIYEPTPLGTGGAILLAQQVIPDSDPFVVTNGDTLLLTELSRIGEMLELPWVDGVILGVQVRDVSHYGAIKTSDSGLLLGFHEKRQAGCGLINAGVYFFKRRILSYFPRRFPLSMEMEVFPALLEKGAKILVYACEAPFLDIGAPQTIHEAESYIKQYFLSEDQR